MMTGEILSSPEMGELAKAMVKVQRALAPVCKDAENPFVKSRYATLNVTPAKRRARQAQHRAATRSESGGMTLATAAPSLEPR